MQNATSGKPEDSPKELWAKPQLTVYGSLKKLTEKVGTFPDQAGASFLGGPDGPPGTQG